MPPTITLMPCSRVIQACDAADAQVLSTRHEVLWPDGSRIGLHPVLQHGAEAVSLRALHHDGVWVLFDLRHIAPRITDELHRAGPAQRPAIVLYGLRCAFPTAGEFLATVLLRRDLYVWAGSPRDAHPQPADHHPEASS